MDKIYDSLCHTIRAEMEATIPRYDATRRTSKCYKNRKPYWSDELQHLWDTIRIKENDFLKCRDNNRLRKCLLMDYTSARNSFDKALKQSERANRKLQAIEIEDMSTTNPTEFWRKIQHLGPRRDRNITIVVLDEDGSISTAVNTVFERWKHDFYNLYNCKEESDFDEVHYDRAKVHKLLLENNMNDPLYEPNVQLNSNVTIDEAACVVQKSKSGSAWGYDELPYEVLKSPVIIACLQQLFQYVFDSGVIPSVWRQAIVCPILKDPSSDRRDPMNYRGISLLSCINKLYTSLLNTGLTGYLETNDMLADEQNGFRKQRSCENHVFTLNSLIKNNSNVFTAFIDLKRCFNYVDRDMLLYKLLLHHIDGKFYNSIKSIYTSTVSAIRINNKLTEWFDCTTGVRQGCNLSPMLYSVFANDLVKEIYDLGIGIQVGECKRIIDTCYG